LIEQAVVAGGMMVRLSGQGRVCKETEGTEPIVGSDDDQTAARERRPQWIVFASAGLVAAAVKIHDDRAFRVSGKVCGPDIQKETILAPTEIGQPRQGRLRTRGAISSRRSRTCPRRHCLWRSPAQVSHGRGGVRHTEKCDFILCRTEMHPGKWAGIKRHGRWIRARRCAGADRAGEHGEQTAWDEPPEESGHEDFLSLSPR